jgi:hypothetical protein
VVLKVCISPFRFSSTGADQAFDKVRLVPRKIEYEGKKIPEFAGGKAALRAKKNCHRNW